MRTLVTNAQISHNLSQLARFALLNSVTLNRTLNSEQTENQDFIKIDTILYYVLYFHGTI
jgi:hypothetical protein